MKMANFLVGFSTFFTLFTLFSANSAAEEFKVGGEGGWRQPPTNETEVYNNWAATLRFHVGDSLRFVYKNDTVVVVDKWGYYHCNSSRAVAAFKNGNTVIKLKRPGSVYFTSANMNHCKNGQRLMVEVMAQHTVSQSPLPAPSPFSGAGSFFVAPKFVFGYVVAVAAVINV